MYTILLQRNKVALGVLQRVFNSSTEIEDYTDSQYPDCWYSSCFTDSATCKQWIARYGFYQEF